MGGYQHFHEPTIDLLLYAVFGISAKVHVMLMRYERLVGMLFQVVFAELLVLSLSLTGEGDSVSRCLAKHKE